MEYNGVRLVTENVLTILILEVPLWPGVDSLETDEIHKKELMP